MSDSAFGFDRPEDSPGFLLWQTMITWQRLIKKALDEYKITHPQFVIMASLMWFDQTQQKPTQVLIVKMTKLDKMTVSISLKSLVNSELAARVEDKIDTRAKLVTLTRKGKVLVKKLIPLVEGVDTDFFAVLPQSKQKELIQLLNKINS